MIGFINGNLNRESSFEDANNHAFMANLFDNNRNFNFSSIQLEFPFQGLRDTPQSRNLFAATFVDLVQEYFLIHLNIDLFSL